ncbi:MAG: peptidoglycan bridge formation glycyltransferase FemA/FemB family protein [Thermacetogeniaceae bacterium]
MYRAQLIQSQDKNLFNDFINSSPKPHFLQSYEWGELKSSTGWEPLRLLVWRDDRPVAAISLLKRPLPLYRHLRRSIIYAPRGPIISENCDQPGEAFFWDAVKSLARRQGAIFIKIDPDIPTDPVAAAECYRQRLADTGFRPSGSQSGFGGVQPRYVFRLNITPTEQELLAAMESKTRYNIHLAERKGVSVRLAQNTTDLKTFYDILTETATRDQFLVRSFSYFERMWDLFVTRGAARIFLADHQGQAIAGTLAFHCGDRVWYLYGASSNRLRNVMPNHLLQWTMIRWAKELGCRLYDFRGVPGSADQDDHLSGLYRFKKGFAATFTEFIGEYDLVLSPSWYFLWTRVLPAYQQVTRSLMRRSNTPKSDESM